MGPGRLEDDLLPKRGRGTWLQGPAQQQQGDGSKDLVEMGHPYFRTMGHSLASQVCPPMAEKSVDSV